MNFKQYGYLFLLLFILQSCTNKKPEEIDISETEIEVSYLEDDAFEDVIFVAPIVEEDSIDIAEEEDIDQDLDIPETVIAVTEPEPESEPGPENKSYNPVEYPVFKAPSYSNREIEYYSILEIPKPRGKGVLGYVSDPDGYISAIYEEEINKVLFELEVHTSAEVIVVIVKSIGDEIPKTFATKLFNEWGIGKADKDNGLLILTVMDQRRTEFETGYGLEAILTDNICYRIGTDEIVPFFKEGEYGEGLLKAADRVKEFVENPDTIDYIYSNDVTYEVNDGGSWILSFLDSLQYISFPFVFVILYIIILIFLSIYYSFKIESIDKSKEDYYDKYNSLKKIDIGCFAFLFPFPLWGMSTTIKTRLKQYRYDPRFSKVNGKPLILLSSKNERNFLKEGEIIEENIHSVDYDVWATDDKSDILILKYDGNSSRKYSKCNQCNYKTKGKTRSNVRIRPNYDREGERIDFYECKNCNDKTSEVVVVAKLVRESSRSSSSSSSSGSSFSSSSSSSSSSSFGGGRSGGGGSGVSW
ncbi:TPM domain-containing protein [Cellulophaga sp. 20_2_10]|uniref:TPM domain-containing protein n=1 Tax=Cellulophaga sp. 20_2_10 TaxID=2942476 RepID=UPI00201A3867|nr:TPM domain-containing protein [Cellulophaga sp. 20_2_10]MCL5244664.1 TPM domain-containing protein [Cellulophaga sp. 20_2_10]